MKTGGARSGSILEAQSGVQTKQLSQLILLANCLDLVKGTSVIYG